MKKERQLVGILSPLLAAFLCPPVFGAQWHGRSEMPRGHLVTNSIGMSFAYVPAGRFLMGSAWEDQDRQYDEHPHPVRLTRGFWMSTTEVTQGQWKAIMGDSRAHFSGDDLPVESVSWADAIAFCEKLSRKEGKSYRLPTESEWEYACRAGGTDAADAAGSLDELAWFARNSEERTHPAGKGKSNAWGLFDMLGNVSEWCLDTFQANYPQEEVTDPAVRSERGSKVVRGGSWGSSARSCRCQARSSMPAAYQEKETGFRVVMSLAAAEGTPATYYVDCGQGIDSNGGTSPASPWKTLEKVNAITLAPGDSVLLKRGTRCQGVLRPKGSGRPGEPISLGAYGNGPLPVVVNSALSGQERGQSGSGQTTEILPTLMLFNQQHWHIRNLELVGGTPWGLYISGDKGVLRHFRITDVVVRNVTGKPRDKRSGLVAVLGGSPEQTFEDVVLEGVTAYGTTQWAGIVVDGGHPPLPRGADGKTPATLKAKDVTVRNCLVHDTAGDGIVLFRVRNGLLESNVAWATGMMPSKDPEGPENPNSIWVWRCEKCVVQYNEGFLSESEGVDGGVYDIDWGSHGNIVQYNYGHDSQGYCISVFGAGGGTTTDSIVRYNVCANNGRSARLAGRQGDLYLSTWGGGSLDGVEIYNNTFYWNPPVDVPFLKNDAQFVGNRPNFFKNNLVLSSVPMLVDSNRSLELDHNLYWYPGPRLPEWRYGGQLHSGLTAFREKGGQEAKGFFLDPLLDTNTKTFSLPFHPAAGSPAVDRGLDVLGGPAVDFFGRPVPHGKGNDIGAVESVPADPGIPSAAQAPAMRGEDVLKQPYDWPAGHGWLLMTVIPAGVFQEHDQSIARSFAVALRSLAWQHERDGLQAALVISGEGSRPDALENLPYDWDLRAIRVIRDQDRKIGTALEVNDRPVTVLISPGRKIVGRWEGRSNPARLGLTLRWLLGPPPGMAAITARSARE